ncbi:MAG TPA: radical SAM protein [Firmicutes bacterium]|nr:radical SAM protein [Bacillota bacterium]
MKALLINPPIYDFSAYDLWAKPLGFLYLADLLSKNGFEIFYFDFLNRSHPFYEKLKKKGKEKYGCGKYFFEFVEKPEIYRDIPRRYKRFGLPEDIFMEFIENIPFPDFIFISTGMTYWYPGVVEVIGKCRRYFPNVPIIAGGTYATFCNGHLKNYGVDLIFSGKDLRKFLHIFNKRFGLNLKYFKPKPKWELYEKLTYGCVKTSYGCPFSCAYCGVKILEPVFYQRDADEVVEEILFLKENFKVNDIAFYDDALLYNFNHLKRILKKIEGIGIRFHTPNGLHPRYINKEVADILKNLNFKTIRLSLETVFEERAAESSFKVTFKEFEKTLKYLLEAGFDKDEIGVYILAGLPGQSVEEVEESIKILKNYPVKIKLAEYSPIPGTEDFEIARRLYPDLPFDEPLFHNNSIYPLWNFENKWEKINELKQLIKL